VIRRPALLLVLVGLVVSGRVEGASVNHVFLFDVSGSMKEFLDDAWYRKVIAESVLKNVPFGPGDFLVAGGFTTYYHDSERIRLEYPGSSEAVGQAIERTLSISSKQNTNLIGALKAARDEMTRLDREKRGGRLTIVWLFTDNINDPKGEKDSVATRDFYNFLDSQEAGFLKKVYLLPIRPDVPLSRLEERKAKYGKYYGYVLYACLVSNALGDVSKEGGPQFEQIVKAFQERIGKSRAILFKPLDTRDMSMDRDQETTDRLAALHPLGEFVNLDYSFRLKSGRIEWRVVSAMWAPIRVTELKTDGVIPAGTAQTAFLTCSGITPGEISENRSGTVFKFRITATPMADAGFISDVVNRPGLANGKLELWMVDAGLKYVPSSEDVEFNNDFRDTTRHMPIVRDLCIAKIGLNVYYGLPVWPLAVTLALGALLVFMVLAVLYRAFRYRLVCRVSLERDSFDIRYFKKHPLRVDDAIAGWFGLGLSGRPSFACRPGFEVVEEEKARRSVVLGSPASFHLRRKGEEGEIQVDFWVEGGKKEKTADDEGGGDDFHL